MENKIKQLRKGIFELIILGVLQDESHCYTYKVKCKIAIELDLKLVIRFLIVLVRITHTKVPLINDETGDIYETFIVRLVMSVQV